MLPLRQISKCFALVLCFTLLATDASAAQRPWVRVRDTHFEIDGAPYRFVSANLWYGMNLGSSGIGGDRPRLIRELDRLAAIGVTHLRILAASEGPDHQPWRIVPTLQPSPGVFNPELLDGLDFLLEEMGKRNFRAVLCLNNFWPWSGGMAQYLNWFGAGPIPYPPPAPEGSWDTYQKYTARFYTTPQALHAAENFIRMIVTRTNGRTGLKYTDDPTIMAWQLANEPRGVNQTQAFQSWIEKTSSFIRALDPRHLITTGTEGETPWPIASGVDFVTNHSPLNIDYATAHIWAQNWGWYDPTHAEGTYGDALQRATAYLHDHLNKAKKLNKPLVIEEFGLARDDGSFSPQASTAMRDRYYQALFEIVWQAAAHGEAVGGIGFWAWAGEGRPIPPFGGIWNPGAPFTGDPPHEFQGWYGVYDSDTSTREIIARYAKGKLTVNIAP